MDDLKETVVSRVPKEQLAYIKDDEGFKEHIVTNLSSSLAERIMGILEREEEIIVKQSDLRVSEYIPTNSVEFKRQISWSPLVRCKDCKHRPTDTGGHNYGQDMEFPDEICPCQCDDSYYSWMPKDDFFCKSGERREDDNDREQ